MNRPVPRERIDRFAELLSEGKKQGEIMSALGITKGEATNCFRLIKRELGAQAV